MISIIIPAFNEEPVIAHTINAIRENGNPEHITEILVIDGGSSDQTSEQSRLAGAAVIQSPKKGRSAQMNYGASIAQGEILYFLHADTIPPHGFTNDIVNAVKNEYHAGCFMLSFDSDHWLLKANSWFTQFDCDYFRFGDQSLFVDKTVFHKAGGFNENLLVMEDQEIIKRIKAFSRFKIIKKSVTTSARKYLENGVFKTKGTFYLIFILYKLGFSQQYLVNTYRKLIRMNKV
jgi:rSAM/selenodomain-associated transferase 2